MGSGQETLTGKQVMAGYNTIIKEALSAREYGIAREALSGLLGAGYIPSKLTFRAMIDGLSLQSDMSLTSTIPRKKANAPPSDGKFQFLLFVLDSLERRKLAADPSFYSSILWVGAQAGGLQKRVASLLVRSRHNWQQKGAKLPTAESTDEATSLHRAISWENFYENYSAYKEAHRSNIVFPAIHVPSKKDFGRVQAAEQAVAYRGGRVGRRRRKN